MSLWSAAQAPFTISQATVDPIVALFSKPHSVWADSLYIPAVVAASSTVVLLLHWFLASAWGRKLRAVFFKTHSSDDTEVPVPNPAGVLAEFRQHVAHHGGEVIFGFKLLRLIACLVLLGLSITSLALVNKSETGQSIFGKWGKKHPKKSPSSHGLSVTEWAHISLCMTIFYATALAITTVSAKRRWSQVAVKHLNLVLLATLATYIYRDVFPLVTYHHAILDASEGWILWTKLGALLLGSVIIPLFIPRAYVPVDPKNPMPVPNPEQTASIFSLMFYFFLDPVVFLGYRLRHLSADQLPPLADYDYAANMRARSFPHLEVTPTNKRHLFFGLIWTFRIEYLCMGLSIIVMSTMNFASPLGINRLLTYLENPDVEPLVKPWVWIIFLLVGPMTGSTAFQWYIYLATRTLVRCEAIITQLVFEHALRIRVKAESNEKTPGSGTSTPARSETPSPNEDGSGDETATDADAVSRDETLQASSASIKSTSSVKKGKGKEEEAEAESGKENLITNLVTTDLTNITESRDFLFVTLLIPLELTLCVVFLYNVLGWSAFVGMAVMILLFPIPGYVAKLIQTVQQRRLKTTDARVQVVTETMNVLRMIKLFGWERQMNERVAEKREEELGWLWKRQMLDLLNGTLNFFIPVATMLATYGTYTVIMKENLSASKVFSSMSVFDMLRNNLHFIFWALGQTVTGKVSLDRVDEFLRKTELLDRYVEPDPNAAELLVPADVEDSQKIGFRDATFAWTSEKIDGTLTPSRRRFLFKVDGELLFKPGCINLVVGPTGSGKTSLLMALLGEMHFIPSGPSSWFNLPRGKGVSYAAQESWETIRENILFGAEYDEERYKQVLHQCALERDLELFDAGDATEVGEKGLTLSGPVLPLLARSTRRPEIILLDDVLAALDVHTSKWIVDKCFRGDLIKGRTIILVTHNVAMAKPVASYVVSMDVDGSIHSHGSISEALATDEVLAKELRKDQQTLDKKVEEVDVPPPAESKSDGKLIVAEEVEEGHVSFDSLKLYFKGMGGNHALLFFGVFLFGLGATEVCQTLQTWFLGYWARQYSILNPADVDVFYYLGIFCILLTIAMTVYALSFVFYSMGVFRASKTIHRQLVEFLDITPTSRVITRCTVDIRTVDGAISQGLWALLEMSISMIVKFAAVILFTPLFIFPGILVGILGGWCGQIYIAAQLSVKREMSNAKAPVLGHFGAAIAGLTSIRAYGAQGSSIDTSLSRIDKYTRTARTFYNLNRWVCVRIDALGGLFAASLAYYLTFNPSNIGFTLNMAIGFSGMILWWVRVLNDFEIQGNSLERIRGYIDIEQEPKPTPAGVPPAYWPASGKLSVQKLSARYSADGPKVLQDISFEIKSGERVGIVGRTGSGKSSLTLALLRTIFTEGNVLYDGIPISSLNLDALRSNITIIPQIPELLTGSLRKNLDVFEQYDDATLNNALRAAGLFALQSEMDEGRITLDSEIASGGGNLSVGQRQILALARAIVRGSKLLILDEATSCHRLQNGHDHSILSPQRATKGHNAPSRSLTDCKLSWTADKIMVLDAGRIVEFDTPKTLLQNKNGKLRALVDESGD
ncbi:hypothetical protein C8F01DRAFT_1317450 [Mycena amicta]|nr:hypothetical protein C8F01DRAFT_1317450 [Mycena amicta]